MLMWFVFVALVVGALGCVAGSIVQKRALVGERRELQQKRVGLERLMSMVSPCARWAQMWARNAAEYSNAQDCERRALDALSRVSLMCDTTDELRGVIAAALARMDVALSAAPNLKNAAIASVLRSALQELDAAGNVPELITRGWPMPLWRAEALSSEIARAVGGLEK